VKKVCIFLFLTAFVLGLSVCDNPAAGVGGGEPGPAVITTLTINGLVQPGNGGLPAETGSLSTSDSFYTITELTWMPIPGATFAGSTQYTAVITLNAGTGYTFTGITSAGLLVKPGIDVASFDTNWITITANNGSSLSFEIAFPDTSAALDPISASLPVTGFTLPATLGTPKAHTDLSGGTGYSVESISWNEALNGDGTFKANIAYSAELTLRADPTHTFAGATTYYPSTGAGTISNGAVVGTGGANAYRFTVTFLQTTPVAINAASVGGLVIPATLQAPVNLEALSAGDTTYTITEIAWNSADLEEGKFKANTLYIASIKLNAGANYTFNAVTPSTGGIGTPVQGSASGGGANGAGNILAFTVTFLQTLPVLISGVTIDGLAQPGYGGMPTEISGLASLDSFYTITNLTWTPVPGTEFGRSTPYTAAITLSAGTNHTFTGITVSEISVKPEAGDGAGFNTSWITITANSGSGLTFEIAFPDTPSAPPVNIGSSLTVSGLVAPATLGTPKIHTDLLGGTGYSVESISWNEALNGDGTFKANIAYSAELTLRADPTYTFAGTTTYYLSTGAGTISNGAVVGTGGANAYRFTATFLQTLPIPISGVTINGLIAPLAGAAPYSGSGVTVDGGAYYTKTGFAWVEAIGLSFATGTVYHADITLKAKANYKFADPYTGSFSIANTTAQAAFLITGGGTNNAENEMTVRVTFAATMAAGNADITIDFADIEDEGITLAPFTIYKSNHGNAALYPVSKTLTLSNPGSYTSFKWYVDNATNMVSSTANVTINAANYEATLHTLTAEIIKSGVYYSKTIEFTVSY
jgi:hypothetical protein